MTQDRTENSRAPPTRHHGFKRARRVSDTYKMCDCFILSCSKNVLIYRNIHFSKIYPRIVKLQQKFTLFWIFPRTCNYIGQSVRSLLASISKAPILFHAICGGSLFYVLLFKFFVLLASYVCFHILVKFR